MPEMFLPPRLHFVLCVSLHPYWHMPVVLGGGGVRGQQVSSWSRGAGSTSGLQAAEMRLPQKFVDVVIG